MAALLSINSLNRNGTNEFKKLIFAQGGLRSAVAAATFSYRGPGN